MDILFIVGWVVAVFMIFFGITFVMGTGFVMGNLINFFDAPSLAVTVGGSLFGIVGMLIGLPFASILYAIFKKDLSSRLKAKTE